MPQGTTDLGSAIDSLFSDAAVSDDPNTGGSGDPAAPEPTPASPPPVEGEGNEPPVESPAAESPEGEEEEEEWTDEERDKLPVDQTGKNRIVSKNRFDSLYRVYKQAKEYEKVLGALPTTEELSQYAKSNSSFVLMKSDMSSDDPNRVGHFIDYWTKASPNALPILFDQALDRIKQDPQHYSVLKGMFAEEFLSDLYAQASQMRAKGDQSYQQFLFGVQQLDWNLNQRFRDEAELEAPADPVDHRIDELRRLEQASQQRAAQSAKAQMASFTQQLAGDLTTVRTAAVTSALKGLAASYEKRPTLFKSIQSSLAEAAVDDMRNDEHFQAQFLAAREQVLKSGSQKDRAALVNLYEQRFKRAVNKHRVAIVREATDGVVEQSKAQTAALEEGGKKTEPTGGAKPAGQVVVNDKFKQAVASKKFDDAFNALFD